MGNPLYDVLVPQVLQRKWWETGQLIISLSVPRSNLLPFFSCSQYLQYIFMQTQNRYSAIRVLYKSHENVQVHYIEVNYYHSTKNLQKIQQLKLFFYGGQMQFPLKLSIFFFSLLQLNRGAEQQRCRQVRFPSPKCVGQC